MTETEDDPPPLNELSKDEWWAVMQRVRPNITPDEFELAWAEFVELKTRKRLQ